jgi:type IV fimbrial biogenesis protein FimT
MRGFSLPELLVVLAVFGVLLAVGVPAFATLQGNVAVAADRQQIVALLRLARRTAVARGATATLCPLAAHAPAPACSPAYSRGWMLYLDRSGDGEFQIGEDTVLRLYDSDRAIRVLDRQGRTFGGAASYRPDGFAVRPLTLVICHGLTARVQRVVMSMTGRVRTESETGSCPA